MIAQQRAAFLLEALDSRLISWQIPDGVTTRYIWTVNILWSNAGTEDSNITLPIRVLSTEDSNIM